MKRWVRAVTAPVADRLCAARTEFAHGPRQSLLAENGRLVHGCTCGCLRGRFSRRGAANCLATHGTRVGYDEGGGVAPAALADARPCRQLTRYGRNLWGGRPGERPGAGRRRGHQADAVGSDLFSRRDSSHLASQRSLTEASALRARQAQLRSPHTRRGGALFAPALAEYRSPTHHSRAARGSGTSANESTTVGSPTRRSA